MPQPPPKGGMSAGVIAAIVIGVVVVLFGGCSAVVCAVVGAKKTSEKVVLTNEPPVKPPPAPPPAPPSNDNWITSEHPYVKFLAPAGWSTHITDDKQWGIFRSPKRDAVLTYTTFTRPGESTSRLGRAASVLGVTDISWNVPGYTSIGKEKFDAHAANGSCNFEGPGGFVWYATVNTGAVAQILLIFAVSANAPRARRAEAQASIDTLQRR